MIAGIPVFEKLFRQTASLDVDKKDLKRLSDLVGKKLNDLLVVGVRNASYNARDIVMEPDLPLTKGFLESLRQFRALEMTADIPLKPVLEHLATYPPLERDLSADVEEMLPELVGALILILGKTMKEVDPKVKNPSTEHWDRVERIFDLTL